jgi:hypothetical protein
MEQNQQQPAVQTGISVCKHLILAMGKAIAMRLTFALVV